MVKAQNEIKESLKLIDVVVEILDARVPLVSQNPIFNTIVNNKARIIVLNKKDLADDVETEKWINYFKSNNIEAIAINSSNNSDIKKIVDTIKKVGNEVQSRKNESKKNIKINPIYRAMIIGVPNVGKSTIINRISKKNSLEVGNKPGVTKKKQWIRIDENIDLLDTPGILWPDLSKNQAGVKLAIIGSVKQEITDVEELACFGIELLIGNLKYKQLLKEKYKLDENDLNNIMYDILEIIGRKRGCIISGGQVDMIKAANCFLDDLRNGKIGKITFDIL